MMSGRKTLEVNPNHPVIADLLAKVKADKTDAVAIDTAQVLFQTAIIESGYEIADPSALVNRVYRLMSKELGVDPDAPLKAVYVSIHGSRSMMQILFARRVPPRLILMISFDTNGGREGVWGCLSASLRSDFRLRRLPRRKSSASPAASAFFLDLGCQNPLITR